MLISWLLYLVLVFVVVCIEVFIKNFVDVFSILIIEKKRFVGVILKL